MFLSEVCAVRFRSSQIDVIEDVAPPALAPTVVVEDREAHPVVVLARPPEAVDGPVHELVLLAAIPGDPLVQVTGHAV